MADYDWGPYSVGESNAREILAKRRIEELREGYVSTRNASYTLHCIRCGCMVGDRKIHDEICPWNEEMLQAGLDKLHETGEL